MNTRKRTLYLLLLLSLCTACSLSSSGGGTVGTGLPGDSRMEGRTEAGADGISMGAAGAGESSALASKAEKQLVSGTLVDQSGKPIAGTKIEIATSGESIRVQSDAGGRFFTEHEFRTDEELTITVYRGRKKSSVKTKLVRPAFTLVLLPDGTLTVLTDRYN